jgi:hypothetical protein
MGKGIYLDGIIIREHLRLVLSVLIVPGLLLDDLVRNTDDCLDTFSAIKLCKRISYVAIDESVVKHSQLYW